MRTSIRSVARFFKWTYHKLSRRSSVPEPAAINTQETEYSDITDGFYMYSQSLLEENEAKRVASENHRTTISTERSFVTAVSFICLLTLLHIYPSNHHQARANRDVENGSASFPHHPLHRRFFGLGSCEILEGHGA